ncbi:efflux RND transporter permease subunit [Desulforhopalus singaporensis]|uniref:SSD domain-containing protein n=1 Tax=Desulforhopalus singaporensis TaxID=91360 RepID=A0A1H0PUT1_9BACT|nr:hypothetical protein [Desulforhopalus singaporensis]SDP08580.1 hypothetical protein SAMN05660330_01764 [Desulforhopalus singaporensis]
MVQFFRAAALFLKRRKAGFTLLIATVTLLGGLSSLTSRVDNSLPVWQSEDDPNWHHYQRFMTRNSISDPLVIYLPATDISQLRSIRGRISEETETSVAGVMAGGKNIGEKGVLLVKPAPDLEPVELATILQKSRKVLDDSGVSYHLGGVWYITAMLDRFSAQSTRTLFPVVLFIVGVAISICIRSRNNVLLVLACGMAPAVQVVGVMAAANMKLNMVLLALPPLTMILGTAYAVHLVAKIPDSDKQTAADLYIVVAKPCLLSAVTTSLGFLSLTFSEYLPVRQLGVWGVVATALALVNALVLLPIYFRPAPRQPYRIPQSLARMLFGFRYLLLLVFFFCCVGGSLGVARLGVGTLILDFFADNSEVRNNYQAIEGVGLGLTPFEVDLEGCRADKMRIHKTLHEFASSYPVVTHFLYFFPSGQVVTEAAPNGLEIDSAQQYSYTLAAPHRVSVLLRTLSSEDTLKLADELDQYLKKNLGALSHPYVTGAVPLYVRGQRALFDSLLKSFGFAFFSISFIIGMALRSIRYGLLAIIPNILPVFFIVAAMGWLSIPLSVSTVTVASIVFGIVVDDSIHFLYRLREEAGSNMIRRLQHSLDHVGPAIIITSLVAGLGFLGFCVSPFIPLRDFGFIVACAMVLALICDLFLLPTLLLVGYKDDE